MDSPKLHCPINGQALIHIGTDKGNDVYWCETRDTAYRLKDYETTGIIIGINPKCPERRKHALPQVWLG